MRCPIALGLLVAALAAGCGGSSGQAGGDGGGLERNYGVLSANMASAPKTPVFMETPGASFVAVFGTTLNDVKMRLPAPNNLDQEAVRANQFIGYVLSNRAWLDFPYASAETNPAIPVTETVFDGLASMTFAGTGTRFATAEVDKGVSIIATYNLDGTDRRSATSGSYDQRPSFSPDGTKVAFMRETGAGFDIFTVGWSGGTPTRLTTSSSASCPSYSNDGTKIAYFEGIGPNIQLWVMAANGTGKTMIQEFPGLYPESIDWTGNGRYLMAMAYNITNSLLYAVKVDGTGSSMVAMGNIASVACAPTGETLAYVQWDGDKGIYVGEAFGEKTRIRAGEFPNVAWGPYLSYRLLVGTGAPLGADCGGFIGAYGPSSLKSFLAFDAVTRASLDVTIDPMQGSSQFATAHIMGDQLRLLKYLNHPMASPTTVISPTITTSYATGAIVHYKPDTGRVSLVATYVGAKPSLRDGTLQGKLVGVWGPDGKNLAPSGAAEAAFDPTTGAPKRVH